MDKLRVWLDILWIVSILAVLYQFDYRIEKIETEICTQHAEHVVCENGKPIIFNGGIK